ncbi:hypothetical protein B0H10DRAFT_2059585 [Mycena sp. CBHHK59/15]|nr:hypothetical protein B0H10DRAFT_2059585 [Mycena sp. CBHHK59/15]
MIPLASAVSFFLAAAHRLVACDILWRGFRWAAEKAHDCGGHSKWPVQSSDPSRRKPACLARSMHFRRLTHFDAFYSGPVKPPWSPRDLISCCSPPPATHVLRAARDAQSYTKHCRRTGIGVGISERHFTCVVFSTRPLLRFVPLAEHPLPSSGQQRLPVQHALMPIDLRLVGGASSETSSVCSSSCVFERSSPPIVSRQPRCCSQPADSAAAHTLATNALQHVVVL